MAFAWPDALAGVVAGDQAVMLASVTPARGVVLSPVTNFATYDRRANEVSVNSSVGAARKLARIRSNPRVALVFHTRAHGFADRDEYVLVQGTATISAPREDFPAVLGENWERFGGPVGGPLWRRWLRVYYTRRSVDVAVERVVVWPDLAATGEPEVHGRPLAEQQPSSQKPPGKGRGPRLDAGKAATRLATLRDLLLGWVGSDGFPMVVPATVEHGDGAGIHLVTAGPVPEGGRRAGLTGHTFTRYVTGQHQRVHTGWLEVGGGRALYAPHTGFGYRTPESRTIYRIAVGCATRWGARRARKADWATSAGTTAG